MHVFLVLKMGMIHKFSYFLSFEEHFKKIHAAYLYRPYGSNCKLSLMLIL